MKTLQQRMAEHNIDKLPPFMQDMYVAGMMSMLRIMTKEFAKLPEDEAIKELDNLVEGFKQHTNERVKGTILDLIMAMSEPKGTC
jgi:hypothetical protein